MIAAVSPTGVHPMPPRFFVDGARDRPTCGPLRRPDRPKRAEVARISPPCQKIHDYRGGSQEGGGRIFLGVGCGRGTPAAKKELDSRGAAVRRGLASHPTIAGR